jgi:(4S)-4-hydroxy-5-phosphonooxypentane-2,3-dione isomerase
MYVVAVTIFVKPEFLEPFKEATLDNARNTRKEPLNVRFDVLQHADHYNRWKAKVADWMAQPRQRATHNSLFFGDG